MSGLPAKVAAVAVNNSASATRIVRFVLTARFERFLREASIQTANQLVSFTFRLYQSRRSAASRAALRQFSDATI
jgi:hypothetical protein